MQHKDGFIESILLDLWNNADSIAKSIETTATIQLIASGVLIVLGIAIIINQVKINRKLDKIPKEKDEP